MATTKTCPDCGGRMVRVSRKPSRFECRNPKHRKDASKK